YRRDQYLRSCHGNHTCRRRRDPINLHRDVPPIIHQHVVDLRRGHTVPAGAVDPHCDITVSRHQFFLKKSRRDFIVIPALFRNRPVQEQHPFNPLLTGILIPDFPAFPVPKLLHRISSSSLFPAANNPASASFVMFPLIRYKSPPCSAVIRSRFSSSRISLVLIQPFCLAV